MTKCIDFLTRLSKFEITILIFLLSVSLLRCKSNPLLFANQSVANLFLTHLNNLFMNYDSKLNYRKILPLNFKIFYYH